MQKTPLCKIKVFGKVAADHAPVTKAKCIIPDVKKGRLSQKLQ